MNKILKIYLNKFCTRYDKDGIIPYLSEDDFTGLIKENFTFKNSSGLIVSYFYYFYKNYKTDKTILFLHGIGPGHTAYLREINELCKNGYKVLTLDYIGCDKSEGDSIYSINEPTKDVIELLDYLNLKEEIIVIGHSLGGYTALNVINLREKIKKAVVISGFYSLKSGLRAITKLNLMLHPIIKYENNLLEDYSNIDNLAYLRNTDDKILFIHSLDDNIVSYKFSTGYIKRHVKNNNLSYLINDGKKHNPNYSMNAVSYMNKIFAEFNKKIKTKELKTFDDKKEYMKDKSPMEMTSQDEIVWEKIFNFIL